MTITRTLTRLTLAGAAALALTACSSADADSPASPTPTASASAAQGAGLTVSDAWVKAAEDGMTAAFGTLENPTDADVVVVGAASPASGQVELHETVEGDDGAMTMRQVPSFTVPAHGSFALEPGGNHLMFMDVASPITPGQDIEVTLDLDGGQTMTFTAPAKDFTGADETYDGGMGGMDH